MLRTIFRKALNKIQDPAKLKRLIADLIDKETWSTLDTDVKGDIYEGLLQKNAEDVKSGAGQYFTPRPLIQAIVDVMHPAPGVTVMDPAAGTGGFLLAAHDYISHHYAKEMDAEEKRALKLDTLRGIEIVDATARLCAMNLFLHGIGGDNSPIQVKDSLAAKDSNNYDMVLTNPPFGKKSSVTIINEEGEESREALSVYRDDFWATTSNNHTLLRLPTGIFYAQGVKANVIFFDRKPASETPWTKALWIYDLRTNKHFTLKTNPLRRTDLDDFISCFHAQNRFDRKESDRFHCFHYEDLLKRDKLSLDITWLRDESLEDTDNLPDPAVLAAEIVEDLQAALDQFALIAADLAKGPKPISQE